MTPDACERVLRAEDDTEAWLDARLAGIGSSDAAALMGESPWASPLDLYLAKTGHADRGEESERMRWGRALEPVIIAEYGSPLYAGRWVERSGDLLRSTREPWAMCTLDAYTNIGGVLVPLEVKNGDRSTTNEWEQGPPRHYWWQLQHQMLVVDSPLASIACLLGGNRLVWCDVEVDHEAQNRLIRAGREFYRRMIERDAPPATEAGDAKALASLYPQASGETVALPAELYDALDEYEAARAEGKAAEEREAVAKARLADAIGEAARGVLPDGTIISWPTVSVKGSVREVQPYTYRRLTVKRPRGAAT